uniref:Transposase n=1 Tax=Anisakis simplex TaxID=6269 RepID=A0A0M3JM02_ANISI
LKTPEQLQNEYLIVEKRRMLIEQKYHKKQTVFTKLIVMWVVG